MSLFLQTLQTEMGWVNPEVPSSHLPYGYYKTLDLFLVALILQKPHHLRPNFILMLLGKSWLFKKKFFLPSFVLLIPTENLVKIARKDDVTAWPA